MDTSADSMGKFQLDGTHLRHEACRRLSTYDIDASGILNTSTAEWPQAVQSDHHYYERDLSHEADDRVVLCVERVHRVQPLTSPSGAPPPAFCWGIGGAGQVP